MSFVGFGWDKQAFGLFEYTRALVLRIFVGCLYTPKPYTPTPLKSSSNPERPPLLKAEALCKRSRPRFMGGGVWGFFGGLYKV